MATDCIITVNGATHRVGASSETPLLYVLRNELALNGPQFGCGVGQCGACTVLVDGGPVRSCTLPVSKAVGKEITTLEGLGRVENPHPVQQAFIELQAAQCGYCANGMIMTAVSLIEKNPSPSEEEIKRGLDGNLCRCGTHLRIVRAVKRAAELSTNGGAR